MSTLRAKYLSILALVFFSASYLPLIAQSNYINQANTALKKGEFQSALEYLDKAKEHCGEKSKVLHNQAILYALTGDSDAALDLLNKNVADNSKSSGPLYNRALVYLEQKNYSAAIKDFQQAASLGYKVAEKAGFRAVALKQNSEAKQFQTLIALAESARRSENLELAHSYYNEALKLRPNEAALYFEKAKIGQLEKNPFVSLKFLESLPLKNLTAEATMEVALLKAYSLGRINKMLAAVSLLEKIIYQDETDDPRPRELLSYYYLKLQKYDKAISILKGQVYKNPNTYVVAGNAALYNRKFDLALRCYEKVRFLDSSNVNAAIGIALCYAEKGKYEQALNLIDALAESHQDNHYVWNTRGVIYKDIGLHHKNKFNQRKADRYLTVAIESFAQALQLNKSLSASFENNKALALFFQDKETAAEEIWKGSKRLASQNNLAILKASQRDYKSAYKKLDSLQKAHLSVNRTKHNLVDYNRRLAKSRTKFNNNYKFVTYYFLTQDKPIPVVVNPFKIEDLEEVGSVDDFEYLLMYSDEECIEKKAKKTTKKKKKTKRRFKLFKKKKKKQGGDCPTF